MAADEISVKTSLGNVDLYVEPNGWAKLFLLNAEGEAAAESQGLLQAPADLVHCLTKLAIPEPEAEQLAESLTSRLPTGYPNATSYLRRLGAQLEKFHRGVPPAPPGVPGQ